MTTRGLIRRLSNLTQDLKFCSEEAQLLILGKLLITIIILLFKFEGKLKTISRLVGLTQSLATKLNKDLSRAQTRTCGNSASWDPL